MVDSQARTLYAIGAGFQIISRVSLVWVTRHLSGQRRFAAKSGDSENYLLACGNFKGSSLVLTSRSKFFLKSSWTASFWDSCTR
jgi:hypothetical protein